MRLTILQASGSGKRKCVKAIAFSSVKQVLPELVGWRCDEERGAIVNIDADRSIGLILIPRPSEDRIAVSPIVEAFKLNLRTTRNQFRSVPKVEVGCRKRDSNIMWLSVLKDGRSGNAERVEPITYPSIKKILPKLVGRQGSDKSTAVI